MQKIITAHVRLKREKKKVTCYLYIFAIYELKVTD